MRFAAPSVVSPCTVLSQKRAGFCDKPSVRDSALAESQLCLDD